MRIIMWPALVPFVSIALLVASLAAGNIWKAAAAVAFLGWLSTLYAIVLVLWYAGMHEWFKSLTYIGFALLYVYVAKSLIDHLVRQRSLDNEMTDERRIQPEWHHGSCEPE